MSSIIKVLLRKINTFKKIFITNKVTKPVKMGDNILLLLSAPDAQNYFDYPSVREQFKDCDLAVVNYMPVYSEKELHEYKPKYFIAIDPGLYEDEYFGEGTVNPEKAKLVAALERVDWDCYFITSVMADYKLDNPHVKLIRLNGFSAKLNSFTYRLYRKNLISPGFYNVIQGALFFAITFGYKKVAIMGCPYRSLKFDMQPDGLHIHEHNHYYDLSRDEVLITNEELAGYKYGYGVAYNKRAMETSMILYYLSEYAKKMGVDVTNYSEGSMITTIKAGILNKEQV